LGVGRGADDPIPEKKKLRYGNLEDASEGFKNRDEWRRALREAKARKGL
jgi:hypothetical protein